MADKPYECNHLKGRHTQKVTWAHHMDCPVCGKPIPIEWVMNSVLDQLEDYQDRLDKLEKKHENAKTKGAKGTKSA